MVRKPLAAIATLMCTLVLAIGCTSDSHEIEEPEAQYASDLAAFRDASFVAEYVILTEGFDGQARVVMYKEGTSRLRLDMVNDGYPTVSILMPHGIDAPDDDDIVCSTSVEEVFSAPRPEITTGACSDEATADLAWTLVFVPFLAYGLPVAESLVPNEAESQVIDDRSANCYRTNADEFSNVCFSDGVLVSVATSNDDWRAELRTLRDLDADEDFALPFGLVD